jgi:hypothetical protein
VSKTQLYEWRVRHVAEGVAGLVPLSRRPLTSPGMTSAEVEDEIVRVHKERLGRWGAKKIRSYLIRQGWTMPAGVHGARDPDASGPDLAQAAPAPR